MIQQPIDAVQAEAIPSATPYFPSKPGKVIWTAEEDAILKKLVETKGTSSWTAIAASLAERSGKQCRERWHNHLEQGIKKGDWSKKEDKIILSMQKIIGNQWAKITKLLPGRTDNSVKNRYHVAARSIPQEIASSRIIPEDVLQEARKVDDPDIQSAIEKYFVEVQAQCQSDSFYMSTPGLHTSDSSSALTTIQTAVPTAVPSVAAQPPPQQPQQWYAMHPQVAAQMSSVDTAAPLAHPTMPHISPAPQQQLHVLSAAVDSETDVVWEDHSDTESLLMDLELVSFEGDTDYLDQDEEEIENGEHEKASSSWTASAQMMAEKASQKCLEIDPCCFSNFDWSFLSKTEAAATTPRSPQHTPQAFGVPQHAPQSVFHQQTQPFQNPMQQQAAVTQAQSQEIYYHHQQQQQQQHHEQQYAAFVQQQQQQQQHAAFIARQQQLHEQTQYAASTGSLYGVPAQQQQQQQQQHGPSGEQSWWSNAFRR